MKRHEEEAADPWGGRLGAAAFRVQSIGVALLAAMLLLTVASVPLPTEYQAILGIGTGLLFLICNRSKHRSVSIFLAMLSCGVSLRYMVWRLTATLGFESPLELALGSALLAAELYAVTVLVLGYVQTIWPLGRKPIPLPEDVNVWPTVDIFIPTYNESLDVVRTTVLGAINIDWPQDKLRIYLLDDGRREEFRQFAQACGISYITRKDNKHAKAGNLNNALAQTDGEFVAIFDCDHIPNRAFLQLTLGWMVKQPRLAMVQTPHHFYSPDPFQRNLAAGTRVPPEGNMFYGFVQDGNDFWNACFFCGSCAVLRRSALEEIGGIATETVTEDAHTMLKLHRRGWESAYLAFPLASGLATERLILHIGQRMRWARGMIQIFRLDNPLLGGGLSWGQRICYLQAMLHFFFGIPRVIFLGAPLFYLLFNQNVIAASPMAIVAYALPHIFHAVATNSRLQKNWRHSFWSEIYETVLALFLVRVTVVTLLFPKRGKFNVTEKGGKVDYRYFDFAAVYPNIILAVLLTLGILRGIGQLLFFHNEILTFQALLLNSIWAGTGLLTVLAALAVGRESRQVRSRARVKAKVPIVVYLPDGRVIGGTTSDLSQTGASIAVEQPDLLSVGDVVEVEYTVAGEPLVLTAEVKRSHGSGVGLEYQLPTLAEEAKAVRVTFGRADAWAEWSAYPPDRPLRSLWNVVVSIAALFRPEEVPSSPKPAAGSQPDMPAAAPKAERRWRLGGSAASAVAALLLLQAAPAGTAQAQTSDRSIVVRPVPSPAPKLGATPLEVAPASEPPLPPLPPAEAKGGTGAPAAVTPSPPPAVAPPAIEASAASAAAETRRVVYTLRQLGAAGPLQLRGSSELQGVQFGIRQNEVVVAAQLTLSGAMSPSLIPEFSNVTVTLNEQYVGTLPADAQHTRFTDVVMPINPAFFQDENRLNFRFTGRYTRDCNDPLSGLLWSTIYDTSTLTLTLQRLPPNRDLAHLPLPFFDRHEKLKLALPFVLSAAASDQSHAAAGIVASWFGQLADYRTATFPVLREPPAEGNAVLVGTPEELPKTLVLPAIEGPTLAVIANPNDPYGSLLVVSGRSGCRGGPHARRAGGNGSCAGAQAAPTLRCAVLGQHRSADPVRRACRYRGAAAGRIRAGADPRPVPHLAGPLHLAQPTVRSERPLQLASRTDPRSGDFAFRHQHQ
jgi:cellulose synthase (UDP-forming)